MLQQYIMHKPTLVTLAKASFDFFVFATSWQPEECYNEPTYSGCNNPNKIWSSQLTIHGMWPQFNNGSWPSYCTNEAFDSSIIYNDLDTTDFYDYWPNVRYEPNDKAYASFWEHEWTKHGTCSGLDQKTYFTTTLKNRPITPTIISYNYGKTITKEDLLNSYDTLVVPTCKSNYLFEIFVCINSSTYIQFDCPESVIAEGNCDDNIKIEMFYPNDIKTTSEYI